MAAPEKMSELNLEKFREMELLLDLSHKVAEADNLDDVLRITVATAATATHSDRGTLFLHDDRTRELYSRVAQGTRMREIRILDNAGIAGHVFTSGQPLVVDNPYEDPRFDAAVDQETGYVTRSLMATPLRVRGAIIGVSGNDQQRRRSVHRARPAPAGSRSHADGGDIGQHADGGASEGRA